MPQRSPSSRRHASGRRRSEAPTALESSKGRPYIAGVTHHNVIDQHIAVIDGSLKRLHHHLYAAGRHAEAARVELMDARKEDG